MSIKPRVHIVSFDVPYPANYGGVIDVFNRVKLMSDSGYHVILHCFEYGRGKPQELNEYAEVHYYSRRKSILDLFSNEPFIVKTRENKSLWDKLASTNDPVLLEGLHSAFYLDAQPSKFWLRTHNIEHEYYNGLSSNASFLDRLFFKMEARKLKRYEKQLSKAKGLLCLSDNDLQHFKAINPNSFFLAPNLELQNGHADTPSDGKSILFTGNLSVVENENAAQWLLQNVVSQLNEGHFVFAGNQPSDQLKEQIKNSKSTLIESPSQSEMDKLLADAQVHLLYS